MWFVGFENVDRRVGAHCRGVHFHTVKAMLVDVKNQRLGLVNPWVDRGVLGIKNAPPKEQRVATVRLYLVKGAGSRVCSVSYATNY